MISQAKDLDRIHREIRILKRLKHPNIIQLFEVIEKDEALYLVMEYAAGGELFKRIVKKTKLSVSEGSKHFQSLIAGIDYCHKLGIAHRDIKPANLMLDLAGNLKICDFGLSNHYEKTKKLRTPCGSPCYAAPEMILGIPYDGLCADLWSAGVVLCAMVGG
jgi:5'-AMP-activated protein kinase, catalytic alpha subunit